MNQKGISRAKRVYKMFKTNYNQREKPEIIQI